MLRIETQMLLIVHEKTKKRKLFEFKPECLNMFDILLNINNLTVKAFFHI